MHWYTCKCLLNNLGRAVEQLAGCFAKETVEAKDPTPNSEACPLMNI